MIVIAQTLGPGCHHSLTVTTHRLWEISHFPSVFSSIQGYPQKCWIHSVRRNIERGRERDADKERPFLLMPGPKKSLKYLCYISSNDHYCCLNYCSVMKLMDFQTHHCEGTHFYIHKVQFKFIHFLGKNTLINNSNFSVT